MLRVCPDEFRAQLNEGLCEVYLLLGNDPFLLQESQDAIRQMADKQGFHEHYTIQIDSNTDWQAIFSLSQEMNLFSYRYTLMLVLPENGSIDSINEQLSMLIKLLHSDMLLIMCGNKLTKRQENATWFTRLIGRAVLVMCQTPEREQLLDWAAARGRQHNLQLDESACQLLCYCYEGNLLALAQALDRLSLLWPDSSLSVSHVKQVVNDTAYFTSLNWIDALLTAKSKRALRILQRLRLEGSESITLLRTLQREVLLLIALKRQLVTVPLFVLFDKYRVWKNRRTMITEAINRLSHDQLRQAVHLLARAELTLKQNYSQSVWDTLERLSLLLCHKALTDVFVDG